MNSTRDPSKIPLMRRFASAPIVCSSIIAMNALACAGSTDDTTVSASGALTVVKGDINGDGFADIALTGGTNWTTLPVAFSLGDGNFSVSNQSVGAFPAFAQQGGRAVTGDFDGDGRNDVALVGGYIPTTGAPWNTIPIAFSNGDGTFRITNQRVLNFATFATQPNAFPVVGDFNGDGRMDIALVGGFIPSTSSPWNTIPVAFSNGDGTFTVTNKPVANFPIFATQTQGHGQITGDFNGDGRMDIALTSGFSPGGAPWNTLPVAFSNGDGTFTVTNKPIANFARWAGEFASAVAGDFNGDGFGDVALVGGSGWTTIPVAFSNGDGTFRVTNNGVANFPTWAQVEGVKPIAGDFNGDGVGDIALTGGYTWDGINSRKLPWGSIPVAFSLRDGNFNVTNKGVANFPIWATSPGAEPASQGPRREDWLGEEHTPQVTASVSSSTCVGPCTITVTVNVVDNDPWDVNKVLLDVTWLGQGHAGTCVQRTATTYACPIPGGGSYAIYGYAQGTRQGSTVGRGANPFKQVGFVITATGPIPSGGAGGSGGSGGTTGTGGSTGGGCGLISEPCCAGNSCAFQSGLVCHADISGTNRCFSPTSTCGAPFQTCCQPQLVGGSPFCDDQTFPGVSCVGSNCQF